MAIHVAVGVIINKNNQVLIAKRANHQHQGNKWEFPGGKVEKGETPQQALHRELIEELGIEVISTEHLIDITHQYDDSGSSIKVVLAVYIVRSWRGEAKGREGQPLKWVDKENLNQYEFPLANTKILSILATKYFFSQKNKN